MIIEPDSNNIRKIKQDDIHILVYNGKKIILLQHHTGEVVTKHSLEIFNSTHELVDRVLELELDYDLGHILTALELNMSIPQECIDRVKNEVWESGSFEWIERAEKLGFINPNENT